MAQGFFLLLPLLHLAQATNYDDYEYYDQEQPEEVTIPRFITEPMTLMVNEGDVIRLPCKVDRSILNQFVLLWRKDSEIIAVDGIVIKDKRLCLEKESDGLALVLGQAELGDEGVHLSNLNTSTNRTETPCQSGRFDKNYHNCHYDRWPGSSACSSHL